jgi:hypothetical protein
MNLAQIIDALPLQVYVRRGELVIHFSTSADLVSRLAETSAALSELDRQADGKSDRAGRRGTSRSVGISGARSEVEAEGDRPAEPDAHSQLKLIPG